MAQVRCGTRQDRADVSPCCPPAPGSARCGVSCALPWHRRGHPAAPRTGGIIRSSLSLARVSCPCQPQEEPGAGFAGDGWMEQQGCRWLQPQRGHCPVRLPGLRGLLLPHPWSWVGDRSTRGGPLVPLLLPVWQCCFKWPGYFSTDSFSKRQDVAEAQVSFAACCSRCEPVLPPRAHKPTKTPQSTWGIGLTPPCSARGSSALLPPGRLVPLPSVRGC